MGSVYEWILAHSYRLIEESKRQAGCIKRIVLSESQRITCSEAALLKIYALTSDERKVNSR